MQLTCAMIIRKAEISDLENIMLMYKSCVTGMLKNGIDQWDETYPNTEIISEDLNVGTYYVAEIDKTIIGGVNIDENQDYSNSLTSHANISHVGFNQSNQNGERNNKHMERNLL